MRFELTPDENTILILNRDRSIPFPISALKRSKLIEDGKDLFAEINSYIETLDSQVQYKMFKCFDEIRELRDDTISVAFNTQQRETAAFIKEFYELLDLRGLEVWIRRNKSMIDIPADLISRDSLEAKQSNHNDRINYYLEDYDGLIFLVIALRPMVPIWGEYIHINKDAVGSKHKEYQAFKLIETSALNRSHQMYRLRQYIAESRATSVSKKLLLPDAAVLEGISSDSLSDYLLATLLVRKVSITNVNTSIISAIYSYLKNKITETSESFKVNPKHDDVGGGDEQRDRSKLENYKITTKLTYGDIEFMRQYARDPYMVAYHVDNTIDNRIVDECLTINHSNHHNFIIQDHMVTLTQWTLAKVFPPLGVYELAKEEVINLISVSQALMIHWGIEHLPLVITGKMDTELMSAVSTTRAGMSDELLDELEKLFPYKKQGRSTSKKGNLAHEDINALMHKLIPRCFSVNPPNSYLEKFGKPNVLIDCPLNIANLLAILVIRANS